MGRTLAHGALAAALGLGLATWSVAGTTTPAEAAKSACIIQEGVNYASARGCSTGDFRVRIVCASSPSHAYFAYSPWGRGSTQSAAWCNGNQRRVVGSTVIQYR